MDNYKIIVLNHSRIKYEEIVVVKNKFTNTPFTYFGIEDDKMFGEAFLKVQSLKNENIVLHFIGNTGHDGLSWEGSIYGTEIIHWEIILHYLKALNQSNTLIVNMLANPFSNRILNYAKPHTFGILFTCQEEEHPKHCYLEESFKIYEENLDFINFHQKYNKEKQFQCHYSEKGKVVEVNPSASPV